MLLLLPAKDMNTLVIIGLIIGLISAAIPIPGTDVWYSQYLAVLLFGFSVLIVNIWQMSRALAIFLSYLLFSTVFVAHQNIISVMSLTQVGLCLLVARSVSSFNAKQRTNIFLCLGGLLTLQVLWGYLQLFNLDPIFKSAVDQRVCDTVGFSGSHNQYGLFLAVCSVSLMLLPKTFIPMAFICVLVAIILSKTFSAYFGIAAAVIYLVYRGKIDKRLIVAIVLAIAIGIGATHYKSLGGKFEERTALWKHNIKQSLQGKALYEVGPHLAKVITWSPWTGCGFGSYFIVGVHSQSPALCGKWKGNAVAYQECEANGPKYEHAHNDYVEVLFDLGFIGCLLLIFVFIEMAWLNRRIRQKPLSLKMVNAALIAFCVCAMSIYTVHTAFSGLLLCVLLGLFYAEVKDGT